MFVLKFEKWRTAALPELTNVEMVKMCLNRTGKCKNSNLIVIVDFVYTFRTMSLIKSIEGHHNITLRPFTLKYSYVHMKPLLGLFMKGNGHFSKWCNAV